MNARHKKTIETRRLKKGLFASSPAPTTTTTTSVTLALAFALAVWLLPGAGPTCYRALQADQMKQTKQTKQDARSMTLQEVERRAVRENPQYRMEQNRMVIASEAKAKAFSYFLPEFSVFAGYAYMNPPMGKKLELLPGVPPLELTLGRQDNYSYGAQMDYLLFGGGRRWYGYKMAELSEEAAAILLEDTERTTLFAARNSYFRLLLLDHMVRLAAEAHRRANARLEQARIRFEKGSISRVEMLKFQTDATKSEIRLEESKTHLLQVRDSFRILLGMKEEREFTLQGDLDRLASALDHRFPDPGEQVDRFLEQRVANLRAEQAGIKEKMQESDFWPSIFARLQLDRTNPYLGQDRYGNNVNVQLRATFPLYQGGRRFAENEIVKKEAQNAKIAAEMVGRNLRSRYRIVYQRLRTLASTLQARKDAMEEARVIRKAMTVGWKNGAATHSDLNDAELNFQKRQVDYYSALVEIVHNLAEMERMSGKDLDFFNYIHEQMGEQK